MADREETDAEQLAMLVRRLDRQRRARMAADAISEQASGVLYDKQAHLKLLQAVAVAANESHSLDEALQAAVDQICNHLRWPVGHAYLAIGTTSILTLSEIWYIDDLSRFGHFRKALETTLVAPEGGVAGAALSTRRAVSSNELSEVLPLPLATAARQAGLVSALAFPVIGIDAPVAVLEFFQTEPPANDETLREVVWRIGELLGKVHVRTRAEATLRSSEEQFRLLFGGNPHPMWIYDAETQEMIAVNDAAVSQYGYSRSSMETMNLADLLEGKAARPEGSVQIRRADGGSVEAEMSGYDILLPGRRARMVMAVGIDAGRSAAEALRESERRFREMLDTIDLAAVLLDVVGYVTYCNPFLLRITGYSKAEVIGRNFFQLFLPEERREEAERDYARTIGRGTIAAHAELDIVARSGERRTILWNNTVLRNAQGSVLGTASIGSDVTEQRQAERQLLHSAFHDALSGLPNRALFLDRVDHALSRIRRDERQCFAVLLLDIDNFKNVNDSLGHAAGDQLLMEMGRRLARCVRGADTVARFGGDEFTVLIESVVGAADATRTADRIQDEISAPFLIEDNELFTSASIGIIIAGPEYENAEAIVRDADTAMYRAKAQGKARSEIFDARMRAEAVARLQLETDLRRAIDRRELRLAYQPMVRLDTREIIGYEALVRWQHPARGMVSPGEFIPLAEETGLIVGIGQFVLGQACRDAVRWMPKHVSVNISSRHFAQSDLLGDVRNAVEGCGLSPQAMVIEITESAIMQQPEAALGLIQALRAMGCRISLDDFGTGYSSLSYLHRFPIDVLKIDASFVREAPLQPKNVEIIRAIIALGQALEIDVIAEGIETSEQHELLVSLGCRLGQGYLFARPAPLAV